jgi:hypothetical protein
MKQRVRLYCLFKYSNGSSVKPTTDHPPNTCFTPSLGGKPRHYICSMGAPVFVQLSNTSQCDPQYTSGEIPVRNRHPTKLTKKFGVCVSGPLIQGSRSILHDLVGFIEMVRLMGAEFIIMYANETQIDQDILEYLWDHYPGFVRTIGWKWFKKWSPLHYFGQLLIISDCLYQVMYEVETLAMLDVDEMIVPVQHNNWKEMIQSLKGSQNVASLRFQNAFFDNPNSSVEDPSHLVPKYFTRTRRYNCNPYTDYRTKVIDHPRFVVEPAIHSVCKEVAGHKKNYRVSKNIGFLAHYRDVIPDECILAQIR